MTHLQSCLSETKSFFATNSLISFSFTGLLAGTLILLLIMFLARRLTMTRKLLLSKEQLLDL